jgi:hypothetical protein
MLDQRCPSTFGKRAVVTSSGAYESSAKSEDGGSCRMKRKRFVVEPIIVILGQEEI